MPPVSVRLAEIVAALQEVVPGVLLGNGDLAVTRLAPLDDADGNSLSFLSNPRYASQLASTLAACVIVAPAQRDAAVARGAAIVTDDPYLYFARLTQWWARHRRRPVEAGVHPSALIEPGARVHASATVGPLCFVAAGADIGAGVVIGSHAHIGEGARVGAGSRLAARVSIGEACVIGQRNIVHGGAVIGADGFGFAPAGRGDQMHWEKIEQLGAVVIGDDVEIGANTCIDRGALADTVIDHGVKLDNLIQIGHNVRIGAHTAMAGCVGVAGSARIGRHCTAGGGAIILGHLELVDHVHVTAATVITRSILKPGQYSGLFPFDDNASWEKNAATLRQLYALRERLRTLEKKQT